MDFFREGQFYSAIDTTSITLKPAYAALLSYSNLHQGLILPDDDSVLDHVLNIKIFEDYYSKAIYQLTSKLICKIVSLVSYPFMDSFYHLGSNLSLDVPLGNLESFLWTL